MLELPQPVTVAFVPLKLTEPDPWIDPKLFPAIITEAPITPDAGERLVMLGVETTVKIDPLLFTPLTYTSTFPVVAPGGTITVMLVAFQFITAAFPPLNVAVLLP